MVKTQFWPSDYSHNSLNQHQEATRSGLSLCRDYVSNTIILHNCSKVQQEVQARYPHLNNSCNKFNCLAWAIPTASSTASTFILKIAGFYCGVFGYCQMYEKSDKEGESMKLSSMLMLTEVTWEHTVAKEHYWSGLVFSNILRENTLFKSLCWETAQIRTHCWSSILSPVW